jgi:hypothetical protein
MESTAVKLTLDMDTLHVESFDVLPGAGQRGTVGGHADSDFDCDSGYGSRVYVCIITTPTVSDALSEAGACGPQITAADCNTNVFSCGCTQTPCLNETNTQCP